MSSELLAVLNDKERQDVWYTLSDLFLDSEITKQDCRQMAEQLAQTRFSDSEIIEIMEAEVAPVLHTNLLCVAGQWGAFDRDTQVVTPIRERLLGLEGKKLPKLATRMWRAWQMSMVKEDWLEVVSQLKVIRSAKDPA